MERLQFTPDTPYSALEASIHLGRYAVGRNLCQGKRVLDAACGEGYGSHMLATWGAASVDGIDISEAAVATAQARFAHPQVTFHAGDVCALDVIFPERKFDLVISLETIEHVSRPAEFLKQIKRVLAPGGIVIISCPNDHWYYHDGERNPFHVRQYTFQQFRALSERTLGRARTWLLGGLAAGFAVVPMEADLVAAAAEDQGAMLRASPIGSALMVPAGQAQALGAENASFFVGVWGADLSEPTAVTFPMSMDESDRSLFGGPKLSEMQDYIARLEARAKELELQTAGQRTAFENETAGKREHVFKLQERITQLEEQYSRAQNDFDQQSALHKQYITSLEQRRDELEAHGQALRAELTARINELEQQYSRARNDFDQQNASNQQYIASLEQRRDELEGHGEVLRAELKARTSELEQQYSRAQSEFDHQSALHQQYIGSLEQRRDELEAHGEALRAELNARISRLEEQYSRAQNDFDQRNASNQQYIASLEQRRDELEAHGEALRSEIREVTEEGERVRAALKQSESISEELRSFIADQRRLVELLQAGQHEAEAELAATRDEFSQAQANWAQVREEAEAALADARERVSTLETKDLKSTADIEALQRSVRNTSLRLHAIHGENVVLRDRARDYRSAAEQSQAARRELQDEVEVLREAMQDATRLAQERGRQLEAAIARTREREGHLEAALATARERELELDALGAALRERELALARVPWRVVSVYWKLRPMVPRPLLHLGGHLFKPAKPEQ